MKNHEKREARKPERNRVQNVKKDISNIVMNVEYFIFKYLRFNKLLDFIKFSGLTLLASDIFN